MNYIERKVISFLDKQEWKSVIKSYKKEAEKKDSLSGGKKLVLKRNNKKAD